MPKSALVRSEEEVARYKEEPVPPLSCNPLIWWKERQASYPLLSGYARYMLCIPATSVPSERVFSTAGDIVTAERACLDSEHVDQLIFLKKNTEYHYICNIPAWFQAGL